MKKIIINENDDGLRVDRFIKKITVNLPNSVMYKMIRKKDVILNEERTEADTIIKTGDEIQIYIHDKYLAEKKDLIFMESGNELQIVYEDENILVVEKEIGLLSHPSSAQEKDSLIFRIWKYLYLNGQYKPEDENTFSPALCGRLDRNTGGILIGAKNAVALRYFNLLMKEGRIERKYLAMVEGVPANSVGTIESPLLKDEDLRKSSVDEDGVKAKTKYKVLNVKNFSTLIEAQLITGRFHQIRVHLSAIGHPLLGDKKYGGKRETDLTHQALYAYKIVVKTKEDFKKPPGFDKYNDMVFLANKVPKFYGYSNILEEN